MAKRSLNRPFKGLDKRLAREQAEREKLEQERQEKLEQERLERERLERGRQLKSPQRERLEQSARSQEQEPPTPPPGSFAALAESSSITPLPQDRARVPQLQQWR